MSAGMAAEAPRYTVNDALTSLEDQFDRVNHLGYELGDRLGGVLRPAPPTAEDVALKDPSAPDWSPLTARLVELQRRLEGHEDRLRDLLHRFDA